MNTKIIAGLIALVLFVCPMLGCSNDLPYSATPYIEYPTGSVSTAEPVTTEPMPTESPDRTCSTNLYFCTDDGYMIPVTVLMPWENGIAKACLSKLIDNKENKLQFQQQGIHGVIPDGTEIELNISDGLATVNLKHMPALENAEEEQKLFVSIVNTLTEFDSVDAVSILLDGKDERTVNGNALPSRHPAYRLNVEQSTVETSGSASALTLYFPNSSGSFAIPVTRFVQADTDLYNCISELVSGTELPNLISCFPDNTLCLGASLQNGVLKINLTEDFTAISDSVGLYDLAMNCTMLTAQQFGSVNEVKFYVNGNEYFNANN